jgi:hypothetical protein
LNSVSATHADFFEIIVVIKKEFKKFKNLKQITDDSSRALRGREKGHCAAVITTSVVADITTGNPPGHSRPTRTRGFRNWTAGFESADRFCRSTSCLEDGWRLYSHTTHTVTHSIQRKTEIRVESTVQDALLIMALACTILWRSAGAGAAVRASQSAPRGPAV